MASSSNGAAARETIIPTKRANVSPFTPSHHRNRWRFWGGTCFLIGLLAAFGQNLLALLTNAARSDLDSYILLVPFVSGYLLYVRRDQLPKNYITDFRLAIVSLAIGASIFIFSYWSNFAARALSDHDRIGLLTLSFLCCLAAGIFLFLGRAWMQAAAFPLAYLIFMVPMPDSMRDALELASKSASAEVANLLFHASGLPFIREGAVFQLPNITVEVAQECSGIRSSWVLFMTSILAADLFLKTSWRRIVLVVFVIPLAILRNGFRILVIGLLCVNVGPHMIHSIIHRRGGPAFFVLSLIPLLLLLFWLHKSESRTRSPDSH